MPLSASFDARHAESPAAVVAAGADRDALALQPRDGRPGMRWSARLLLRRVATAPSLDIVLTPWPAMRPLERVADHVPPGQRGARPVHQRERVDPRSRRRASSTRSAAPTCGSTSSSPAAPTRPAASSARWPTSSSCSAIRTARSSRASAWRTLPAFVFLAVDGTVRPRPRAGTPPSGAQVADDDRRDHGVDRARASRSPATPARSTARPRSADRSPACRLPAAARRPARRRASSTRSAAALAAEPRRAVLVAPPGAGKTTVVPLRLLDEPWLGGRRSSMLEPRRLATRAAAQRMAALLGEDGRRTRRLPDPRRAPHRPRDAHRGRHRGRADPPPAARSRARRRRRW